MRIQKLKINGFKSFAQKVEIQFEGNGLTAIVGPNGCGKSNIVDSIRWVMGEQRAGQLRMDKMQGVIFSGTEERPALNMAEVSLFIENDRGLLPSEYSEVMVTRRAFSNGESEYLINNQECRLADIRNLFADTGMGAGSYSQMDQRMVDALLSDKADERRTIFEEAAGVSKYKKRRKDASAQLEKVQLDMERIATDLQYAKSQFRQQERMLARAQELRKLKGRLKEVDVSVCIGKYGESKKALSEQSAAKAAGEHELETLRAKLAELETKIAEKRLLITDDEERFRESERDLAAAETEIATLNEAYKHLQNRSKELEENALRCEREIGDGSASLLALKENLEGLEGEIESLSMETSEIEIRERKESEALQCARGAVEDLRARHRELFGKRLQFAQEEGKLKSAWQRADTEMEMLGREISKAESEMTNIDSQMERLKGAAEGRGREIGENEGRLEMLRERQSVLANEKEDMLGNLGSLADRKTQSLANAARLESRLEALQSIGESAGGFEGNKWVLDRKSEEGAVLLSGRIEVLDSRYAALVEFCLGSSVQAVFMQNQEAALECAGALSGDNLGRALLAWNANLFEESADIGGEAVPLVSLVKAGEGAEALVKSLLSKYFLASDIDAAARLAKAHAGKDLWFCTEDCQAVCAIGLARLGREQKESVGVLQRRAELKSLTDSLEEERARGGSIDSQINELNEKIKETDILISNAAEEKQEADASIRAADFELKISEAKMRDLAEQREKLAQSVSGAGERLRELEQAKESNAQLSGAAGELEKAESEFERIDGELREREQMFRNQEELAAELKSSSGEKRALLSQKENSLRSIEGQMQALNNAISLRKGELEIISGKRKSFDEELEGKAIQIEKQHGLLEERERLRDAAREKYSVVAGGLEEWREEVSQINRSLLEKEKTIHHIDLAMQNSGASLERMRERVFQEYEFDLEKEPGVQSFAAIAIEERDALFEIKDLQDKIKAIGPVNASAAEDYEAEKERVLSIETQYNDVAKAKASLSTAIERLDIVARDRFLDTFRKIQKNYQEVFASLMPGGEALISMQGDLDPLEAEIEINARPTGKKMRGVRALSGGERALTATSLLFALYMVKPSPYCILDEIDGPLDDANIGRFVGLLRRFSHQTQFVVITHNKRTMAGCDMLYGVSQEISGVSKVGSVRLEEAEAYSP